MKTHRHLWELTGTFTTEEQIILYEKCPCGVERERKPTKKEKAIIAMRENCNDGMYKTYIDMMMGIGSAITRDSALEVVNHTAEDHPDEVIVVNVDDDAMTGGKLVFVDHKKESSYFGTSFVFLPFHPAEKPTQFFMYPKTAKKMRGAFASLVKKISGSKIVEEVSVDA